jgi:hypothetical protein
MGRYSHVAGGFVVALLCLAASPAAAQGGLTPLPADEARELNLRAYVDLMRSDIRSQKSAIIAQVMQFSETEDQKFWPIYREYEAELAKVNDERLALIAEYAGVYQKLTDAVADRLARAALDVESRRHALKAKYYDRLQAAVSPTTAARFLQVENQILLLLDLQIAASLPLIEDHDER